jgi:hypothetical protein
MGMNGANGWQWGQKRDHPSSCATSQYQQLTYMGADVRLLHEREYVEATLWKKSPV